MDAVQNNRYGQLRLIGIYYINASWYCRESITLPKLVHGFCSRFIHFAQSNKMRKKPNINDSETSGKTATCALRYTELDIHKSMR